jgi:16S rRNA (guanine527-N7)-methyltransferase
VPDSPVTTENLRERLGAGLAAMDADRDWPVDALAAYVELLSRWNRAYNLSAVRDPLQMVSVHVLDSLAVEPVLRGQRLLDVGAGAGLPGIPLALVDPEREVTLLDSNGKKVRFLRQAALELGLRNVEPVHARVQDWQPAAGFDTVICRAYTSLSAFWHQTRHLLAADGVAMAMKGRYPEEELGELAADDVSWQCRRLDVPGLEAERHVIILEPVG